MGALWSCLPLRHAAHYDTVRNVPKAVVGVFEEAAEGKEYLTGADLKSFFENFQGDTITEAQAEAFVENSKAQPSHHHIFSHYNHESNQPNIGMTLAGFAKFLLNPVFNGPMKAQEVTDDMTAPLSQYYLHTSHNSYLTGNQLWSRSSTAPIIEALDSGCRVIELDCWEKHGKVKVLHGGTLTSSVDFDDCITAIKDHAFTASPYPVIITIENHLRPEMQVEAAKILKEILGELLFIPTEEQRDPVEFLSPEELKGKIVISDKPYRDPVVEQLDADPDGAQEIFKGDRSPELRPNSEAKFPGGITIDFKYLRRGAQVYDAVTPFTEMQKAHEFEEILYIYCHKPSEMEEKHEKGGPLLCGEKAIMANISEPQFKTFIKSHPSSIVEYTRQNFGRVYPFGLRFDSSNADPMSAWSHGCQLAALNLQGQDRAAWLGHGFFLSNGACGYVKKPQIFLQENPLPYEEILELPPKFVLKVKVLMGTDWHRVFDFLKSPDFYVRVAVKGIPSDTRTQKTKVAYTNKEPNWEDEEFEFPLRVPEIAVLRFEVWEYDRFSPDDFVGQACFPVTEILQGIRVVPLRSRKGKEISSKILCQFKPEHKPSPAATEPNPATTEPTPPVTKPTPGAIEAS